MDQQRHDQQYLARERDTARNDREQDRDDLSRRREQQKEAHLTRREREERWPIG